MSLKRKTWTSWMGMGLLIGLVAILSGGAVAKGINSPLITAIEVAPGKEKLKVHVSATGEIQYRVLNLNEGRPQLVVEMFPAQLSTSVVKSFPVNTSAIEKVRVGQFSDNPDVVRVVVDLNTQTRYQIAMAPGRKGLTVALSSWEVASAKAPKADTPVTVASIPVPPPAVSAPVVAPVKAPAHAPARPVFKPVYIAEGTGGGGGGGGRRGGGGGGNVNLDFVNADLVYVLKLLAKEMGYNLVTDSTVKGSVTMSLKGVPAYGALKMVLAVSGFDHKIVDHTIVVGSKETLSNIPADIFGGGGPQTEGPPGILPIPLENAKAASVAETVKGVYPGVDVTVQADQNFIIVKGPKSQLRDIKEFVQKLDVPPPPPVVLKTEIIPIKYGAIQTVLQLAKTLHPNLSYNVEDRLNSLIVTGSDKDIDALKAFLATVDIPLQQVLLDIKVVDLNESGQKQLGFQIGGPTSQGIFGPISFNENVPSGFIFPPTTAATLPAEGTASITNLAIGGFVRSPFIFNATINLLISQSDAKVISSPRVVAQSGKEAQVLIGDKFPIVYFDPRAGQFQVQYVDIGVKLVAKPLVASDGFVTMELTPSVSVLRELINNQYPRTGETSVKTTVRVRDGDTFVLGGLLREVETLSVTKLPFLGDLPVLGEFFRNSNLNRSHSEVYIMVTPKIMQ